MTGEFEVIESAHDRDQRAKQAGVVLMPAVGFDVVPTDCLAVLLSKALPTATQLPATSRCTTRLGGRYPRCIAERRRRTRPCPSGSTEAAFQVASTSFGLQEVIFLLRSRLPCSSNFSLEACTTQPRVPQSRSAGFYFMNFFACRASPTLSLSPDSRSIFNCAIAMRAFAGV